MSVRLIVSRQEAISRGLKWYFTGIACPAAHLCDRQVSNSGCRDCSRARQVLHREKNIEAYRAKERALRAGDPQAARDKGARNYAKNKDAIKLQHRARYAMDPQRHKDAQKRYRENNIEVVRQKARLRAASYRERFPDRAAAAINRWWADNPDKKKTYHRNRRARKRENGGSHTAKEVAELLAVQKGRCVYCHAKCKDDYHVDHIIPLALGGGNSRRNLQILCPACNLEKGAADPIRHARTKGMLI